MSRKLKYSTAVLFLFLVPFQFHLFAQTNYSNGSVISLSGDTIYGDIDHRVSKSLAQSVTFKADSIEETTYYPFDIEGFCLNDGRLFVSRIVEEDSVFLEFLVNGELDLYYQRRDDEYDCYYIQRDGEPLVLLPYYEEVVWEGGDEVTEPVVGLRVSKRHIGLLKYYTQDAPELVSRIDDLGQPKHRNLKKIVIDYHEMVCDGEECIVYQEEEPGLKLYPKLKFGISAYEGAMFCGAELNLKVPRLNERMYLKTGLEYHNMKGSVDKAIVIPLAAEYVWPKGWIRPKISLGTCFALEKLIYSDYYIAKMYPLLGYGINLKAGENVFVSLDAGGLGLSVGLLYVY